MKVIVVGASSGIGLQITKNLVARGDRVVGIARRTVEIEAVGAIAIAHDVTDTSRALTIFQQATDTLEGLDVVIYCAGLMEAIGPSDFDIQADHRMIAVNVGGAVTWLDLAATRFLSVGHGAIVAIGSVAGERGRRGQPTYNASKAFVHTFAESLRNRGLTVATIKPGPVATPMTEGLSLPSMMPAEVAAEKIVRLIGRNGDFFLNPLHRIIFAVIRWIPGFVFRKLPI